MAKKRHAFRRDNRNPRTQSVRSRKFQMFGRNGFGADGAVTGGVGKINNNFSLGFTGIDGAGGHVTIGQPSDLNFHANSSSFSVGVWMKYGTDTSAQRCIMSKAHMNAGQITLFIGVLVGGAPYVLAGGGNSTSGGNVADGNWHFIMVTGSGGSIKLYVDGTQVGSTFSAGSNFNNTDDWVFGGARFSDNVNIGYPYKGQLNEVTFWNIALNSTQVSELWNSGVPINPRTHSKSSHLLHWYQCGSNDPTPTILDRVQTANGTMVNTYGAYLFNDSPTHTPSALDSLTTNFNLGLLFNATSYSGSGNWTADAGGYVGVLSGTPHRQVSSQFTGNYEVTTAGSSWWRLPDSADHAITTTTQCTYVLRMNTGLENGTGGFFCGYDSQSTVSDLQIYNFNYDRDAGARIRQKNSGSNYLVCESFQVQNKNYVTVHVVVDIPNTTLSLYVNGGLVVTSPAPVGLFQAATLAPLGILGNAYLSSGGYNSTAASQTIMQVARYNQVLTPDQIMRQAATFNSLKGYL